ncbi:MAG: helix-turn-helix domain-containing protein [Deltaproteobacteria bacterium]|nr:helix-turn-helix domain-containing protein [Deltaproteobacteria bacterium]
MFSTSLPASCEGEGLKDLSLMKLFEYWKDRKWPEILNLQLWQEELSRKPFNLKQAAEYLGISTVTIRRWVKSGRLSACKAGWAYIFEVKELKALKKPISPHPILDHWPGLNLNGEERRHYEIGNYFP